MKSLLRQKELHAMRAFHSSDWRDKVRAAMALSDRRLRELARRIIYFEYPEMLSDQDTKRNWMSG